MFFIRSTISPYTKNISLLETALNKRVSDLSDRLIYGDAMMYRMFNGLRKEELEAAERIYRNASPEPEKFLFDFSQTVK